MIREEINQIENFHIKLKTILKISDFKNNLSSELSSEKLFIPKESEYKILNKSIIYYGERTGYTWGLLKELDKLKKIPSDKLMSVVSLRCLDELDLSVGTGILFQATDQEIELAPYMTVVW